MLQCCLGGKVQLLISAPVVLLYVYTAAVCVLVKCLSGCSGTNLQKEENKHCFYLKLGPWVI